MRCLAVALLFLILAPAADAAQAPRPSPPARSSPAAPPPAQSTPTPLLGLSSGGLPPLGQGGDARPQCRAQCAKARYQCSPDDQSCDERWTQCLAACAR